MLKVFEDRRDELKKNLEDLVRGKEGLFENVGILQDRIELEGRLALYTEIEEMQSDDSVFLDKTLKDLLKLEYEMKDYLSISLYQKDAIKFGILTFLEIETAYAWDLLKPSEERKLRYLATYKPTLNAFEFMGSLMTRAEKLKADHRKERRRGGRKNERENHL